MNAGISRSDPNTWANSRWPPTFGDTSGIINGLEVRHHIVLTAGVPDMLYVPALRRPLCEPQRCSSLPLLITMPMQHTSCRWDIRISSGSSARTLAL